ncbi:MAG TPA: glycoside hydrolase family 38 C-terminal domain-containing protein [Candidatus Hydrogenedentes bacterium]|nr:glycoside hydrolase family 38 C-terminal domain-containing protein [Candidatus Hydrogenedentota bacterium]
MVPIRLSDLAQGQRIRDWLVLGPFVVRTGDHFEREYMYERERILDIDYLAGEGGEAAVCPVEGQAHANIGLGPKKLVWRRYTDEWLGGMDIAGEIIYETVQRNCVIYAAACVAADADGLALMDAYTSGMKVWVNGELACNMPYGLPKGVRMNMPSVPVRLRKGENTLLFKFRPGYICDGVDFCVGDVTIAPLVSRPGMPVALGRVRARPYFQGSPEEPRQVIEAALLNSSRLHQTVRISLASDSLGDGGQSDVECAPNAVTTVRLSLPTPREKAGMPVKAIFSARLRGETLEAPFAYEAAAAPKYDGTVLVLSSFHFDTTYHEEQRVYAMGAFDLVRQYCRLHRADPLFRSIISEVDYLKPYFDVYPEDRETLMRVFREKRSEPDVMYNQPNEQNCGDEGLVRNFLYGQLIHGRVFGNICHVYGPGDVFGHPNQLSQIARKSGCIGVTWGKHIFNFPPFFNHLSLDGSSLPHQRGHATEDDVHEMGLSVRLDGIDQTPPTQWHHTLMPLYRQGAYEDLMAAIHRETGEGKARLPVTSRDMSLYHAATAVSRVDLKIANRLGENLLIDAEKFATIANLLGAKYPEKALDKAWRQILCGQHHDSITGTHNEISFVDLMNSYREILELGTECLNRSIAFLGEAVRGDKKEQTYAVFNSLAWERTDVAQLSVSDVGAPNFSLRDPRGKNVAFEVLRVVRDAKGHVREADIRFVAVKMPSLGYRAYTVVPKSSGTLPACKTTDGRIIENAFYRITVDPARGGGISSIYDKTAKREIIESANGHVGNELAILEEVSYRNETQHEFYTTGLKMFSGDTPASVEIEQGAVSRTIRARYRMGELCDVIQETTLFNDVPRIEFRTILVDVQREHYLYCVTFPTNLKGLSPIFDERFGVVARNDSKNYLDFRTHQMLMFGDCAVYAANKFMEYGSSAKVQIGRNVYSLSMVGLVTPKNADDVAVAEELQRVLVKKGVTCTPWHGDGGPYWGTYLKHMDDDMLYTRFRITIGSGGRNAYTKKLLGKASAAARNAFKARLKKNGYAFLFVKDADLKDPSWPALPVLIVEAKNAGKLAEACETLLAEFPEKATITLPAAADASGASNKMDDYGLALLNRGNYANSIEKGGTLCMILGHACLWYGGTNNFPEGYLIPENKNHVYGYALYPHAGDWRKANTPRAAYAYNHPLIARRIEPSAKGCLPAESSFAGVSPENVILTAMKPFGNPIASFERNKTPDASQGVMIRVYDTMGRDAEAKIVFGNGIEKAWAANLIEEPQGDLAVKKGALPLYISPFSIETVGFKPAPFGKKLDARILGPEAEPVQPVWVRSWEHDAESMPMGYAPVVCSISREVKEADEGRTLQLRVNVVNDYTDSPVSGGADLVVPDGWQVEPAVIAFTVEPLKYQATDVIVRRPDASAAGQIKLRHAFDGQVFQDVLEIGGAFNLDMDVRNEGDAIIVTLRNPHAETVEAEVSLVSPIETWPRELVGPHSIRAISPRTQGVSLAAGTTTEMRFTVAHVPGMDLVPEDSYWAVAKLMSNGRITLKRCDRRPETRRMWSDRWFRQYFGKPRGYV